MRPAMRSSAPIASSRSNFIPIKIPDDPHAEEKFKELGEAYDVLMDEQKRAAYDRYGHAAFAQGGRPGGGFHDPFDIFREVFGSGGGGGGGGIFETFFGGGAGSSATARQRGSDLRYDMQITLEEAAFGVEKEIEVRKLDTCAKCDGSGADARLARGHLPDLPRARPGRQFARIFPSLADLPALPRARAKMIERPCDVCDGEGRAEKTSRIKIKIPAGIAHGSRLRSARNGEAGIRGGGQGDLYIVDPHQGAPDLPARGRQSFLRSADLVHHGRARRRSAGPDPGRKSEFEGAGRHAGRADLQAARQRRRSTSTAASGATSSRGCSWKCRAA